MKKPKIGTFVWFYMSADMTSPPLPALVEALHGADGLSLTTFYRGQATYRQCVLLKGSKTLVDNPKLALMNGCWTAIPDDEPVAVSTSAPTTAVVEVPENKGSGSALNLRAGQNDDVIAKAGASSPRLPTVAEAIAAKKKQAAAS